MNICQKSSLRIFSRNARAASAATVFSWFTSRIPDTERIKRGQEALTKVSHKLAEIMYRESQAKAQAGGASTGTAEPGPKPAEGDVVDAEFEDLGDKK